jgi:hypothetical protein
MWGKEWAVPEPAPQTYFLAEIVADFGCGIIFGGRGLGRILAVAEKIRLGQKPSILPAKKMLMR